MSYSFFTIEERISIKHLLAKGVSVRRIERELGRSVSSVSREIARNGDAPNEYGEVYTVQRVERPPSGSGRARASRN